MKKFIKPLLVAAVVASSFTGLAHADYAWFQGLQLTPSVMSSTLATQGARFSVNNPNTNESRTFTVTQAAQCVDSTVASVQICHATLLDNTQDDIAPVTSTENSHKTIGTVRLTPDIKIVYTQSLQGNRALTVLNVQSLSRQQNI
jgi:hypothetical protein